MSGKYRIGLVLFALLGLGASIAALYVHYRLMTRGGDLQASRLLWQNLLSSEERWMRTAAERRLTQLDAIEQIQQLQSLTSEYQRRHGNPPPTWDAMIKAGLLRGLPTDPTGVGYVLDQESGNVTIDRASSLGPLPTEGAP